MVRMCIPAFTLPILSYCRSDIHDVALYSSSTLRVLLHGHIVKRSLCCKSVTNVSSIPPIYELILLERFWVWKDFGPDLFLVITKRAPTTLLVILMGMAHAGAVVVAFSHALLYIRQKIFFIGICSFYMIWFLLGTIGNIILTVISSHVLGRSLNKDVILPLIRAGLSPEEAGEVLEALLNPDAPRPATEVLTAVDPSLLGMAGAGIKKALAESYRFPYLVSIAFGGFACVLTVFIADVSDRMTNKVEGSVVENFSLRNFIRVRTMKVSIPEGNSDSIREQECKRR